MFAALLLCAFAADDRKPAFKPGDILYTQDAGAGFSAWCVRSASDIKTVLKFSAAMDTDGISKMRAEYTFSTPVKGTEIRVIERATKGEAAASDVYEVRILTEKDKAFPGNAKGLPDKPTMYIQGRYLTATKPEK